MKKIFMIMIMLSVIFGLQGILNLTLEDCIEIARENNKDLENARTEVEKYHQDYYKKNPIKFIVGKINVSVLCFPC